MPVFALLVFLGAALLWLLLSFIFVPLGRAGKRLWKDAKDAINDNEENSKTKKGE